MENQDHIKYNQALRRVKRIKGFYTHLLVYIVINTAILISKFLSLDTDESFFTLNTFSTTFFWGIGLLAHFLSVFLPQWFLGKDWEEKKIKELIENQKKNKWE